MCAVQDTGHGGLTCTSDTRKTIIVCTLFAFGVWKHSCLCTNRHDRPLDASCSCMVCRQYTRSYLYHTVCRNLPFASHLLSLHNVAYMQRLTREMREAIKGRQLPEFVREFLKRHYPKVCLLVAHAVDTHYCQHGQHGQHGQQYTALVIAG